MSVVAGDFKILARVADGIRPVRVLGTKADISGQQISIPLAQLYARQERYFVLEVEVDAGEAGSTRPLVDVSVEYQNMITETIDKLSSSVAIRFAESVAEVERDRDYETFAYCTVQIVNERNRKATALRDAGQVDAARSLLNQNALQLYKCASECASKNVVIVIPELKRNEALNKYQAQNIGDDGEWGYNRKQMRATQNDNQAQQTYRVTVPE